MGTWQLENNHRWSKLSDEPKVEEMTQIRRGRGFTSISDLSLKGYAKIKERDSVNESGCPNFTANVGGPLAASSNIKDNTTDNVNQPAYQMFRTGPGKPVLVNHSSLSKASAILGLDPGCPKFTGNVGGSLRNPSTFQNGFTNSLALKMSPLSKASSLLSNENEATLDTGSGVTVETGYAKIKERDSTTSVNESGYQMFQSGPGKPVVVNQSAIIGDIVSDQGCPNFTGNVGEPLTSPSTFQNGFRNSLARKKSSLSEASSPCNNEIEGTVDMGSGVTIDTGYSKMKENSTNNVNQSGYQMFRTGSGKPILVNQSSLSKASAILGDVLSVQGQVKEINSGCDFGNSMFQTGSGKKVKISTSGLARAQNLLCLKDKQTHQGFEETMQQLHARASDWQSLPHLGMKMGVVDKQSKDKIPSLISPLKVRSETSSSKLAEITPDSVHSISKPSSIKFHTAGGRSISVSSNSLQRARSLLGDPELGSFMNEGDAGEPVFSIYKDKKVETNSNKLYRLDSRISDQHSVTRKQVSKNFISPLRPASFQNQSLVNVGSGKNLIGNFDAVVHESTGYNDVKGSRNYPYPSVNTAPDHSIIGTGFQNGAHKKPPGFPEVAISNTSDMGNKKNKQAVAVKRVLDRRSSGSFKRPRLSKSTAPFNNEIPLVENGSLVLAPEESSYKNKVSSRYPYQASRKYVKEYFGVPPFVNTTLEHLPACIRTMNPDRAEQHCFPSECGFNSVGKEAFYLMLMQSGASMKHISETWVSNHYKWIIWKLACYERCYLQRYLTVSNVMEELKYRYEREVNHGHRSAIKKILEGDAPPSSVLVLCISSVQTNTEAMSENISTSHGVDRSTVANVELTDGWYSINAVLDAPLSKKLASGKLFVGQKLKISGAGICGWVGPVSPLEASPRVSLVLHINGTYRTHWADRLGFCKTGCAPLAFNCIKSCGGAVPCTFVGLQRIYPVLYRERLSDGEYTISSERMEAKMQQLYNQRRSDVVEGVMSELLRADTNILIDSDGSDEAEKILAILERSAEPDILMAGMSSKQLKSLSVYQAKLEATRQSNMNQSIEKALKDSGLRGRNVTPFMRLSVVGLTTKIGQGKWYPRKGMITLWNPTEQQQIELVEGRAYAVSGLIAFYSDSDTLYLQARGSTTTLLQLSSSAIEHCRPFFNPRKPISLYNFDDVPLSSEFDIAGHVVFVGGVYETANQRKQWVFVTDCSVHESHSRSPVSNLLAINFSALSTGTGHDLHIPISHNLVGSTVGFCNITKKEKDQTNHIWVAETTENSDYSLIFEHKRYSHLKAAAVASQKWSEVSSLTIEKLKQKVFSIIGKRA
ncbi:protein BREAST CANCER SUSCEPTIBILITY 2 homolog A-like isoform X1 [Apium graveolens]|uniref:protein BREAST CANCER SUSCEPTIBILITY 2 homolog A-like isoform X1 n=1 Tax=Apium graveolens TaxID=4045 RepID=UPI003D7B1A47